MTTTVRVRLEVQQDSGLPCVSELETSLDGHDWADQPERVQQILFAHHIGDGVKRQVLDLLRHDHSREGVPHA